MAEQSIDYDPVTHITIDAIGKPGQRTFFIQAWQEDRSMSLVVEKVQIQTLAVGIEQFLKEITERFPDLPEASGDYDESQMHIQPPIDPLFRVGEVGLGYDEDRDLMVLIIREIVTDNIQPDEARTVRFWGTRSQMRALGLWGLDIAGRGRPICPYCGQPMEPEGHFCPKKNGHKH
jgi:uncharacterized repeat protein (TIGR03847 family)